LVVRSCNWFSRFRSTLRKLMISLMALPHCQGRYLYPPGIQHPQDENTGVLRDIIAAVIAIEKTPQRDAWRNLKPDGKLRLQSPHTRSGGVTLRRFLQAIKLTVGGWNVLLRNVKP
jgi:hypothetical protein